MQHEERMPAPRIVEWEHPVQYEETVNAAGQAYWERPEHYEQHVKNEPPRGERDCVEQLEGVPYFEPSASGDQTKERSGDPTQTAVAVKNEDVGVPENAVKNDDCTPGVPSTEPFVEEGPSVKCQSDEVATVPNGEAPVEHDKTIKTATVSVCTANGLAELDDPNNLSDTTEPTPNLEMLLENADTGSVLGTLDEDATFAQREQEGAATTNSVDPVAHAELEGTTEKPEEDTTKEDGAGSPPPHARYAH
ncbi:hypothetical protein PR002_g18560 [Phytophthora rubi]|uniref:Uncharacterized protein n=1 Tax=Phytophthora rubi TaxID=129364 RepID=A0A6A3K0F9_9STRA|nr:hypothetical protein PR002_g18560 [Phytophthora rubi]